MQVDISDRTADNIALQVLLNDIEVIGNEKLKESFHYVIAFYSGSAASYMDGKYDIEEALI